MDFVQPMMELLKLLGTLGAYSLTIAVVAVVGILVFKLTQLVSILLLIKYGILRFFDWAQLKKTVVVDKSTNFMINDRLISTEKEVNATRMISLFTRLSRIKNISNRYDYILTMDIDLFEEAIIYLENKYHKKSE